MSDGFESGDPRLADGDDDVGVAPRYRALLDLVDEGLYQLDPEGRFVAVDDVLVETIGCTREDLVGAHVSTVLADGEDAAVPADGADPAALTGESSPGDGSTDGGGRERRSDDRSAVEVVEATLETTAGEHVPVELRQRALLEDGRVRGTLGVVEVRSEPTGDRGPVESPLVADETTTSVLEEADVGVFILDETFQVRWVDSTAATYFGIDRAAVLDRDKRELIRETIADRVADPDTFVETVLATYDDNSYVERFECHVTDDDGEERWLEHRSRPIESGRYAGGRVELYYDVSAQHRRARQLQRLNEAVREWLELDARTDVADRASEHLQEILGMDVNGVFLHDEASSELRPVAWSDPAAALFDEVPTFGEGEGIAWRVFESGEPEVYDDVRDAPGVYDSGTVIRSEIVLPIGDHGVLEIGSTDRADFDDGDLMLAKIVASTLEVTFDRIDNQRRLEARKEELETELGAILDRVTDAFYAVDEEFRLTHVNERAAELLQHSAEELLGERIWDVFPRTAEVDAVWEAFHTAMNEQEQTSYELYYESLDVWVEANLYPSATGISVYFRDITERKEHEQALEESNERLEQFAYAASHDLQEPLRMVSSYLRLIERRYADDLDEEGREFIDYAVDGADRMREMIHGLLAYSRVESRGNPFERVDLEEVLGDVMDDLQLRLAESDADLEIESLPTVRGDPSQLRQVFQNLLENAVEYSGEEPPRIRVSAERDGDEWVLSVRDEGIGIDPEDADRIFRIFQRLHSREAHSGAGIGLALCERIVERHGGDIWVESESGEGATFRFSLPTAADPDA